MRNSEPDYSCLPTQCDRDWSRVEYRRNWQALQQLSPSLWRHRQTGRQIDRQTDKQTGRQTWIL